MQSTDGRDLESDQDEYDADVKDERRDDPILWAGPLPPEGWTLARRDERKVHRIGFAGARELEAKH